jgi:predicted nucleic acid-binding protein
VKQPLVDVNVILDALLDRPPQGATAAMLWAAAEQKRIEALVPAHGVTTLFYLVRQGKGAAAARRALSLGWTGFEDAVCAAAAEAAGCDLIVTRDPGGFRGSPVPVVDTVTALSLLEDGNGPGNVAEGASRYGRGARRRRRR